VTNMSNMHVWTLVENCLVPLSVGFFGVQLIRYFYLSCAISIKKKIQKRRQDAESKRILGLLFGTDGRTELETFYIDSSESCSICLVRMFYIAVFKSRFGAF